MIIGIYGNIGSGKTTYARMLNRFHDYEIVSCDQIAKELLANNQQLIDDLKNNKIGTKAIDNDQVNSKKMTRLIFGSYRTNKAVSDDVWPYVKQVVEKLINEANQSQKNLVIEAATLPALEINGIDQYVYVQRHLNLSKIIKIAKEKHKSFSQILNILKIQKKYNRKYIKNSYVIKNLL